MYVCTRLRNGLVVVCMHARRCVYAYRRFLLLTFNSPVFGFNLVNALSGLYQVPAGYHPLPSGFQPCLPPFGSWWASASDRPYAGTAGKLYPEFPMEILDIVNKYNIYIHLSRKRERDVYRYLTLYYTLSLF